MSTTAHHTTRFPRGRRTGPAVTVALLILVAAAAAAYLAVTVALGRPVTAVNLTVIRSHLTGTTWVAPEMLIIGIAVAGAGLVLLLVAALPAPRQQIELTNPDPHTAAALPEPSLRRTLQSAAVGIDGISAARARIGRRRIRLDLTSGLRHPDGLTSAAQDVVGRRLRALDLARPRSLVTHLHRKDT